MTIACGNHQDRHEQDFPLHASAKLLFQLNSNVLEACNFIKKGTLAQVLSCEFCEISRNIFFTEHLWMTACE